MKYLNFPNCKYNSVELALRFEELGNKFIDYFEKNKTVLNFNSMGVEKTECGTVACHGGFGIVVLGNANNYNDYYIGGAILIAKFLGFEYDVHSGLDESEQLTKWALDNSEIWGNMYGSSMFSYYGYLAFDKTKEELITLEDIAKKYFDIAYRLTHIRNTTIQD